MDRPEIEAEGPTTEWKERLPALHKVARTLSAFANGGGGQLWVGVRDDGRLCGVPDPEAVQSGVDEAANLVDPRPEIRLRTHATDRGNVIEVIVKPDGEGPAAVLEADGSRQIYPGGPGPALRADAPRAPQAELNGPRAGPRAERVPIQRSTMETPESSAILDVSPSTGSKSFRPDAAQDRSRPATPRIPFSGPGGPERTA